VATDSTNLYKNDIPMGIKNKSWKDIFGYCLNSACRNVVFKASVNPWQKFD